AALRGPAPEGAELHVLIERLLETTLLGPRVRKPQMPQSGQRPSAALRAGLEGYRVKEYEGTEQGEPEPDWLAALPAEPEQSAAEPQVLPAMPTLESSG